jgi:hypothetical protein
MFTNVVKMLNFNFISDKRNVIRTCRLSIDVMYREVIICTILILLIYNSCCLHYVGRIEVFEGEWELESFLRTS